MLDIKIPLNKSSDIVNWCTSTQVNRLSKCLPTQDLINIYMHLSIYAIKHCSM